MEYKIGHSIILIEMFLIMFFFTNTVLAQFNLLIHNGNDTILIPTEKVDSVSFDITPGMQTKMKLFKTIKILTYERDSFVYTSFQDTIDSLKNEVVKVNNKLSTLSERDLDFKIKAINAASIAYRENARLKLRPFVAMFIGNSWTKNATEYLYQILHNIGVECRIYRTYKASGKLEEYYNNIGSSVGIFEVTMRDANSNGWVKIGDMTTDQIFTLEDFDLVSFQQQSGHAGDYSSFQPYLDGLISHYKGVSNIWAKIYFHSTLAYPEYGTHRDFALYNNDTNTMYNSILDSWSTAMVHTGIYNIIPNTVSVQRCADLWQEKGFDAETFYTDAGKHLHVSGMYAAALGYAQVIIDSFIYDNEKSILDCTYFPSDKTITPETKECLNEFKELVYKVVKSYKDFYSCFNNK